MLMFLVALFFSVAGLAILSIPFWLAMFPEETAPAEREKREPAAAETRSRFFAAHAFPSPDTRVPIEALLARIENHIRLEQAAAESFLESPTVALLHSRTISPLVQ